MGTFVSTFIPYDAIGQAVNLDTEYMYRDDGLKLEVVKLGLNIYYGRGKSNVLFEMAKQIETDLLAIIRKLENHNAE